MVYFMDIDEPNPVVPIDETFAESAHQLLSYTARSIKDSEGLAIWVMSTPSGVGLEADKKYSYILYLKVPTAWMTLEEAVETLNYHLLDQGSKLVLKDYKSFKADKRQGLAVKTLNFLTNLYLELDSTVVDHKIYITAPK